jgi:hypothetical protein
MICWSTLFTFGRTCRPFAACFAAADADAGATIWGGLGPQVAAARTFGVHPPARSLADTEYREQTYFASGGFNWSAATFGRIKTATANAKIAELEVARELDQIQAAVVTAHHNKTNTKESPGRTALTLRLQAATPRSGR